MFERILVTLDGHPIAEQALAPAVSLARRLGSRIYLVTVREPLPHVFLHISEPLSLEQIEFTYLTEVAERIRHAGVPEVFLTALDGDDVARTLEKHRKDVGADLTVMCTHARTPVERAWMGSVADRFTRASAAPVLLVKADTEILGSPEVSPSRPLRRILVPLDGSKESEVALAPAMAVGRPGGAAFTLARMLEYPLGVGSLWLPRAVELTRSELETARRDAEEELASVCQPLRDRGADVTCFVDFVEHVGEGITGCAESTDAELIVMASRGRGGITRIALGSVTDKVVRTARCPVLVVPMERSPRGGGAAGAR